MKLEDDDIREFAEIWKEEFHEVISPAQARESASQLVELYLLLLEGHRREPTDASGAGAKISYP